MRIGILSQWYDPEPGSCRTPGVLARGLASRGHEVTVLTGFPNAPEGIISDRYRTLSHRRLIEELGGVRVIRVPLYPYHGAQTRRRLRNYGSFATSASLRGVPAMGDLDALWVYNSPATIAIPMWLLRFGRGVPYVLHNMDMWPDSVAAAGFMPEGLMGRAVWSGLSTWCDWMYRGAHSVAYISPSSGELLRQRGVPEGKLHYVPIWTDESIYYPRPVDETLRSEHGITDQEILLLYAGLLGKAQDVAHLARAVIEAPAESPVRLWVMGDGIQAAEISSLASSSHGRVRYFGLQPNERVPDFSAAADAHLVALGRSAIAGVAMPSKVPAILASGKPLLVWGSGDAMALVRDGGIGIAADAGEPGSGAASIANLAALTRSRLAEMGTKARARYERDFSADRAVTSIEDLLESAAASRNGSRHADRRTSLRRSRRSRT